MWKLDEDKSMSRWFLNGDEDIEGIWLSTVLRLKLKNTSKQNQSIAS